MELLEVLELLPRRSEGDRSTHNTLDAQRCAASGIPVELGQDHPVEGQGLMEGRRRSHGILAGHCIDDEEREVRLDGGGDSGHLVHQGRIDGQSSCGVDNEHVSAQAASLGQACGSHRDRIGSFRKDRYADLLAEHPQLLNRSRALQVGTDQHWITALLLEPSGQLGRRGRLSRPLKSGKQDDRGRARGIGDREGLSTERLYQLLVDRLDDLLARRQRLGKLDARQPGSDAVEERPDHTKLDISLEQGRPDLGQCLIEIRLRETATAAQLRGDPVETV